MDRPAEVRRGADELRQLLREQTFDLRGLDPAGFRRWLGAHLARWRGDLVFAQRALIRDLRRAHPELHALDQAHRRAAEADAASAQFPRLRELGREVSDAGKAVGGLSAALERAGEERRPALRKKLEEFRARREALEVEQADLLRSSPRRQALLRAEEELRGLRVALGLEREEARLEELLKRQGRRSGRTGESFERLAQTLAEGVVVPDLLREASAGEGGLRILRGVTLGSARAEFDLLVVRTAGEGLPVDVLAVVEVKRNLNDLAHGFRRRQQDLAWLTGEKAGYDPQEYRTGHFRAGHFDRPVAHEQGGETFLFAPGSFERFRRDPAAGLFLDRLYLVTRAGTMWGVSAAALARIAWRVATDERWEPDGEPYLRELMEWCQSLAGPTETPDVLRLYASTPSWGRQVLVAERTRSGEGNEGRGR